MRTCYGPGDGRYLFGPSIDLYTCSHHLLIIIGIELELPEDR